MVYRGGRKANNMISFVNVLEWHKGFFPEATFKSQLVHLAQEIKELNNAVTDQERLEEGADVVIVLISLRRFEETKEMAENLLNYYYFNTGIDTTKRILKEIEKKIEIINKRKYFWNGEDYDRRSKIANY